MQTAKSQVLGINQTASSVLHGEFIKWPIYGTILTCSTHTCAKPQNKEYSRLQCGENPMNAEINN